MLAMQVTVFMTYCKHIIEKQNLIISVRERSHNSSVLTTQHLHIHTHTHTQNTPSLSTQHFASDRYS